MAPFLIHTHDFLPVPICERKGSAGCAASVFVSWEARNLPWWESGGLPPPIGSRSDPCRLQAEEEDRAMSTSSAWSGRVSPFDSSRALHVILFSVVVKEIYW